MSTIIIILLVIGFILVFKPKFSFEVDTKLKKEEKKCDCETCSCGTEKQILND
jgi:hypothetical protein